MLLIKYGKVIRDDNKVVINGLKDLEERLKNHKGETVYITYCLLKDYYEIYIEKNHILIGYYPDDIKNAKALKSFLRKNNFKSSDYGIKF